MMIEQIGAGACPPINFCGTGENEEKWEKGSFTLDCVKTHYQHHHQPHHILVAVLLLVADVVVVDIVIAIVVGCMMPTPSNQNEEKNKTR